MFNPYEQEYIDPLVSVELILEDIEYLIKYIDITSTIFDDFDIKRLDSIRDDLSEQLQQFMAHEEAAAEEEPPYNEFV